MEAATPPATSDRVAAKPRARSAAAPAAGPRRAGRKPRDPVTAYAQDVAKRAIVAGPHVRAACARHLRDLDEAPARGWKWNLKLALYYIRFIETFCCLSGGAFEGKPFLLAGWQKFIVGSLFGWVSRETGARRFSSAYIEIAKGNGKSPLAAAIGMCGLLVDEEPRAEIYSAATKKDQAMILFRDAVAMVDQSPELARRLLKSGRGEQVWNLAYAPSGSWFRPISSDDGQSGARPHIGLVDEVHEHKDGYVLEMLRRGFKGRRQPMLVEITNSGSDRQSICFEHHEASVKALHAKPDEEGFDDAWFAYVCALDEGDDWMHDPACWIKANPNLGVSQPVARLEEAVRQARNMPSQENLIARLHFCVWTDATSAWIGREHWDAAQRDPRPDDLIGLRCFLGLDLGARNDMTAAALYYPDAAGGGDLVVEYWTPEVGVAERERRDRMPYREWLQRGFLNGTPGASVDYSFAAVWVRELLARGARIDALVFDRWRIFDFLRELDRAGVEAWVDKGKGEVGQGLRLVPFGQGFESMSPAVDEIEAQLMNRRLRVHRNPVLTWNCASAVTETDAAGNRKFTKRKATGRIDGLVAGTMAIGASLGAQRDTGPSVYESRGILEVEVARV